MWVEGIGFGMCTQKSPELVPHCTLFSWLRGGGATWETALGHQCCSSRSCSRLVHKQLDFSAHVLLHVDSVPSAMKLNTALTI